MQIKFGVKAKKSDDLTPQENVVWEYRKAVNAHMAVLGMSGAGKSFQLRSAISQVLESNAVPGCRIFVYDVHGDLTIDGASDVMFSMQTSYGLNPLKISADPHFGGPRRTIQNFISTMNRCLRVLGVKQESCLRHLLFDVYARHGFTEDPRTWRIEPNAKRLVNNGSNRIYIDCPSSDKDALRSLCANARYDTTAYSWWVPSAEYQGAVTRWPPKLIDRTYPTISDVLTYAKYVLHQAFTGADAEAISYLEVANKAAKALRAKKLAVLKSSKAEFVDEGLHESLDKARKKSIDAYTDYVKRIVTGAELNDLLKYNSNDVLVSVIERLESLIAIGVFKDKAPPFDPTKSVWRFDLRALSLKEEKKLFVMFHILQIFQHCVSLGETNELRYILVLDEGHMYTSSNSKGDEASPIDILANEGRKFGLGLWVASQSPTHFNDDFMTSVGTKVILGIDESFWKSSASKLNLDVKGFEWIRMQKNMIVQIKCKGDSKSNWVCTNL
ncbi:MAG: DUF87 domain-containing protein [Gammaproteobacteria bacterium]|nr:MAG: DUF87 domain-containing protein [Gammaproteobacteria bacterium]